MARNDVHAAFEILLEEIELVANATNEAGAEALKSGRYEEAQRHLDVGKEVADFRAKLRDLQQEWSKLFASGVPPTRRRKREIGAKLKRGLRTPEERFHRPILEAIEELGGSAPVATVLDRVKAKLEGVLNEYDYQPLPSNRSMERWRNTAQWCRNTLVREGLIREDSPKGLWAISEQGRQLLRSDGV